uniref:Uncharacterized protein n=1 Tax=Oryza barthii TaxID=65489 RepID=A0A0D3FGU3_9ORYZ
MALQILNAITRAKGRRCSRGRGCVMERQRRWVRKGRSGGGGGGNREDGRPDGWVQTHS